MLPQFEGPFDLLLFFIERDELDIYDIPIAQITDDFLGYLQEMKALNIDLASEFILVAATLMRIKAKMLIPRKELDEDGNEIDPRQDLVQALVEYKRYKEVLGELKNLEEVRLQMHKRGTHRDELKSISDSFATETELGNLSLYRLMRVFQKVLNRMDDRQERLIHKVTPYAYTMEECRTSLITRIRQNPRLEFTSVFELCQDRIHAIFTLLAVLDLAQRQQLKITASDGYNNFWIETRPIEERDVDEEVSAEDSSESGEPDLSGDEYQ